MSSIKFHARNATFKYATGITISDPIDDSFSAGTTVGIFKDVSVTGPEGDVSIQNYLGEDTNGFQNADFEESAFGEAEISGTMVVDDDEILATIAYGSGTAGTAHTLYQVGDGNRPTNGAILVNLDNGTDEASLVLNNIIVTQAADVSVTGEDGHWEMSFTAKCLPKDFYFETKD